MKLRGYLFSIVAGFGLALVSGYEAKSMLLYCQDDIIKDYEITDVHAIDKYDAKTFLNNGNIRGRTSAIVTFYDTRRIRVGSGSQVFDIYTAVWRNSTQ